MSTSKILPPGLLPLVKAIELATGQRVHLSTAIRWINPNRSVRLKSWLANNKRLTTVEAVCEFVIENTNSRDKSAGSGQPKSRSEASRKKAADKARKQLESAGI